MRWPYFFDVIHFYHCRKLNYSSFIFLINYLQKDWDFNQWNEFCEKAGFKANFDVVVSRGYCQGDCSEVLVPHEFWESIGVKKPSCVRASLGDTIDHLLWDCPIYCRFTVNEEEFYIDQCLADMYNWEKSEALRVAAGLIENQFTKEEAAAILDFLKVSLPEHLECV